VPGSGDLNLEGLTLSRSDLEALLSVDKDEWSAEVPEIRAFFDKFGTRLPAELDDQIEILARAIDSALT